MKLYAIGYYKEDESNAVSVIPAKNDDEAWWKAQCWLGEMLGVECDWIMAINSLEEAEYWINRCEQEKYQC